MTTCEEGGHIWATVARIMFHKGISGFATSLCAAALLSLACSFTGDAFVGRSSGTSSRADELLSLHTGSAREVIEGEGQGSSGIGPWKRARIVGEGSRHSPTQLDWTSPLSSSSSELPCCSSFEIKLQATFHSIPGVWSGDA